ncbi:hypothetical protein AAG906_010199 [Vitis piasezkii]
MLFRFDRSGLVNLGQPSVTTNPLPTHSTHADDNIHMLSWDDGLPEPIVLHDSYEIDGDTFVPFTLWPEDDDSEGREIQIVTRSGRIAQPPPPAVRPFEGTASHEEVRREDDEIRVETTTTPEGLIHMMTVREVMGTLMIDLQIGPATFSTLFRLSDGGPASSFPLTITPTSPDRASMLSLCFPEEITGDGVIVDPTEVIDGVVPHDEYRDEMDMMTVSQITGIVQLQPVSAFDMFGVSTIEVFEGTQTLPVPELPKMIVVCLRALLAQLRERPTLWTHLFLLMFYRFVSARRCFLLHLWI